MGKHSLKFGANFMRSVVGRTKLTAPAVQYQGLPDLLANVPSQINITFGAALHDGFSHAFGGIRAGRLAGQQQADSQSGARYDYYSNTTVKTLDPNNPAELVNLNGLLDNQFHFGPWRDPTTPTTRMAG